MTYYIIKPRTFSAQHTFLFLKKKDVPDQVRSSVKRIICDDIRKVHRFSTMIEFCENSCENAPYRLRRVSWVNVLQTLSLRDEWSSDGSESDTSSGF
jgi:hypothetical protein